MSKVEWTPWHQVVELRDDLRSGSLALSQFAADLYDVVMDRGDETVYRVAREFFALTYPTHNLRQLARKVAHRLAGRDDKAVLQLQLTYGGGKTHALITLFHLFGDPASLPDLPAVKEFLADIGFTPPKARVAVLPFDKLDIEKGMDVRGPQGSVRKLKQPWSVLAYQLAGDDGLRLLHAEDKAEERVSPPAENLLNELLAIPAREGLATLILIDELLLFARRAYDLDKGWGTRLVDFFQYLTQAVEKASGCALVASLLASDVAIRDEIGKKLEHDLQAIFRRKQEESIQPVEKEDVAEVLRRRFFKPDSIKDTASFKQHVVAGVKGLADIDEAFKKDKAAQEERFADSYPFHPDLTELFYSKWTNLEQFQRTRGVLRTFALALRDAARWDESPLVDVAAFLRPPKEDGLSDATRSLTDVAESEDYEGKRHAWSAILESELKKAREAQAEHTALRFREVEQAVIATFLHSQPIGQKVALRDILLMLGDTRPDRIELNKALKMWADTSWFLDEAEFGEESLGANNLPKFWRLGSKPNLKQMHHDAVQRVNTEMVNFRLREAIQAQKKLTEGAVGSGVRVNMLPARTSDVEDDGDFHYVVLGVKAASESGKPSAEAVRFINETTGPDRPRVYRNAIVLAVPSLEGLDMAREAIKAHIGWEEVKSQLSGQEIEPTRKLTLEGNLRTAAERIASAILQAYCIVVTVSDKNEVQAFKLSPGNDPLFDRIKADKKSRIKDTAVTADALLPGGPYELWREGEREHRMKDLQTAFAQRPHLPKMLSNKDIVNTLVQGVEKGIFVMRLKRPDQSVRTYWRERPGDETLKDASIELVLPEAAELAELHPSHISPSGMPWLWAGDENTVAAVLAFFDGKHRIEIEHDSLPVPKASAEAVFAAISQAVEDGLLWLTSGPASLLKETVPASVLTMDAVLRHPPVPIPPQELLPENLPAAWSNKPVVTARDIADALATKREIALPWATVQQSLSDALRTHYLQFNPDSERWPCEQAGADKVLIEVRKDKPAGILTTQTLPLDGRRSCRVELSPKQIQDLADNIGEVVKAAGNAGISFELSVDLGTSKEPKPEEVDAVNCALSTSVPGACLEWL